MPFKLEQPVTLDDFSSGMIDDISVANSVLPRNAVRKAMNVIVDRPRGAISQRLGTTKLGATVEAGQTCLGLHNFRAPSSANHQLFAAFNGAIYHLYSNETLWETVLTGINSSAKCRFLTYLGVSAVLNGVNGVQSWDGVSPGSYIATGGPLDVGNFPVSRYASILNGRVFTAGDDTAPCRLYASSIVSSGAISWTSGNKFIDVFVNDGAGNISSIIGNGRMILIFKERAFYRYDDSELQRVVGIGTQSHESVFNDDNGVTYFFGQGANTVGFYHTTGGYPQKLSRAVTKWVEAIDPAFYQHVNGFTDGTKAHWSIGSVTVDGSTYSNCWLIYNISDQTWEARNYADRFRVFSQYINAANNITIVAGDTDGMVQTINSGYTDNTEGIAYECEMAPQIFTGRGRTKVINEVIGLAEDYQGLHASISIDGGQYQSLGSIDRREKRFAPKLRGQLFSPRISGVNSGAPFTFEGFSFTDVTDEGTVGNQ